MNIPHSSMEPILRRTRVMPIITIRDSSIAADIARALVAGGLSAMEVTLRTPAAFDAIAAVAREVPQCTIGAGTVLDAAQFERAAQAGAKFAVSPGTTDGLLAAAARLKIAFLPAVSTPTEMMRGYEAGYDIFKFFPAEELGGPTVLRKLYGPLPHIRFCASGSLNAAQAAGYAGLPNVLGVGGAWMAPAELVEKRDWAAITALAKAAAAIWPAA